MEGLEEKYCKDCGEVLETWPKQMTEHRYTREAQTVKEPTCTENGTYIHACENYEYCHSALEFPIPALGHDYHIGEDGIARCSRCGDEQAQTGEQHQHVWGPRYEIENHGVDGDIVYRSDCLYCTAYKTMLSMPPHDGFDEYLIVEVHEP